MQRVLTVLTFFIFFILPGYGQKSFTLKGEIRDKTNGEGIPFAHIGLCGKTVGTVSNIKGEFILNLAPYLSFDTLCISAIGYTTLRRPVHELLDQGQLVFELDPQVSILNELVISDDKLTPRRYIQKAAERISKNYPLKPYLMTGYYRDYLKKGFDYISLLEAGVTVQDFGFSKPDSRSRIRVDQLRYNPKYVENFRKYLTKAEDDTIKNILEGIQPFVNDNEFINMKAHDLIRNHSGYVPIVGVFDEFYNSNYEFEIVYYTQVDNKEVCVIQFRPGKMYQFFHMQVSGEIFIRTVDFAIVKFEYNYIKNLFGENKKLFELKVEYREVNGKMYLKYISYVNSYKLYTGDEIADLMQYREFFVTNIQYEDFNPLDRSADRNRDIPLHEIPFVEDPDFWDYFNIILLEKPLKD